MLREVAQLVSRGASPRILTLGVPDQPFPFSTLHHLREDYSSSHPLSLINILPLPGRGIVMSPTVDPLQKFTRSQTIHLSYVTLRKPPKPNSDSEIAAICPCDPQPTIGKSRESRIGRGSGMTSPCLSFLTQR